MAETASAQEGLRKAHAEVAVVSTRCAEFRDHAHRESSARLEAANQHAAAIRSLQRGNQDLKAEAQILKHQLDQLTLVHPSAGKASSDLTTSFEDKFASLRLSAEQKVVNWKVATPNTKGIWT